MYNYLKLVQDVMRKGVWTDNRTGIDTVSIFGTQLRFDLRYGLFPLVTTKKMHMRGIFEELMWFLRGQTNSKILEEKGVNIWRGNTTREALDKLGLHHYPEGEGGEIYGSHWRNWNGWEPPGITEPINMNQPVDQIEKVIEMLRKDFHSRRILVTAWNPSNLHQACLPPCHVLFQFYSRNRQLSCQFYMRSVDIGLGLPYNITSYALLTYFIAAVTGHGPHELIFTAGDTHIYENHVEPLKLQLTRSPRAEPTLKIKKPLKELDDILALEFSDIEIEGYDPHPTIKMKMAV